MKNVAKKLANVIKSVSGQVKKSGHNSYQNYDYVMESDLLEAVRGELINQSLVITTSVETVKREGDITEVRLKHTFIDVDSGETLEVYSAGQGQDKGDKGVFKAITGANKYFLLKMFQLSGNDDPENDVPEVRPKSVTKPTTLTSVVTSTKASEPLVVNAPVKPSTFVKKSFSKPD